MSPLGDGDHRNPNALARGLAGPSDPSLTHFKVAHFNLSQTD